MGDMLHSLFWLFPSGRAPVPLAAGFNPTLHLAWDDVAVDSREAPYMVKIRLKQSKMAQFSRGVDIVRQTDSNLCPMASILAYIVAHWNRQGLFFLTGTGTPLTKPNIKSRFEKSPRNCWPPTQ